MKVYALGIDPGLASVGVAVVEIAEKGFRLADANVVRTKKADKKRRVRAADDDIERVRTISSHLIRLVDTYRPVAICAESMSFPRNASTAAKMALCWGAIAAIAEERGLPLLQVTPQELKLALTGSRSAAKEEVQEAVRGKQGRFPCVDMELLPKTQQEHAYDAIAAVMACESAEVIRMARQIAQRRGA